MSKARMGRPIKYQEPTKKVSMSLPETTLTDLDRLAEAMSKQGRSEVVVILTQQAKQQLAVKGDDLDLKLLGGLASIEIERQQVESRLEK